MPLCVSAASSSSLDEYMTVGFEALLELALVFRDALVLECLFGVDAGLLEGDAPIVADGGGFAAGEKLIVVCRLRSRLFLGAMFAKLR